ncbi:hypothetical protein [Oceanicaulis alexandrii]|uniref:hypothetical protein n=1 Tax=Oceanicaulis alexandrii TaxID=153233 RepID=UPI001469F737|nr:hypothetical protein [Oceanicaulis alexandrii]
MTDLQRNKKMLHALHSIENGSKSPFSLNNLLPVRRSNILQHNLAIHAASPLERNSYALTTPSGLRSGRTKERPGRERRRDDPAQAPSGER